MVANLFSSFYLILLKLKSADMNQLNRSFSKHGFSLNFDFSPSLILHIVFYDSVVRCFLNLIYRKASSATQQAKIMILPPLCLSVSVKPFEELSVFHTLF